MINFDRSEKRSRGFTVIELMVIIVVIGILATIGVIEYGSWRNSTITAQLKSDLTNAAAAMENYRNFNSSGYPSNINSLTTFKPSPGVTISGGSPDGKSFSLLASNNGISYSITDKTSPVPIYLYTGTIANFTVPTGVTSITITAKGAQGGQYSTSYPGGKGASVTGTFTVSPGQVLSILVGQQPPPNLSVMPGGGGGTFVASGASYTTATRMIVAGGGGGSYSGGAGQAGQITNITTTGNGGGPVPGTNGNGAASTSCAGGGGGFYTSGGNDTFYGTAGAGGAGFRQGGAGGVSTSGYQTGGFGGGATADYVGSCNTKAGSGGGYSGGSGQNSGSSISSGWGGGSYNGGTAQTNTAGANSGNGQVSISWGS